MTADNRRRSRGPTDHRLVATVVLSLLVFSSALASADEPLIASISKATLWRNRDGQSRTWFHPRACMIPGRDGKPVTLMNLQEIGGSDYFGQVHWSISEDLGKTWSEPEPIAALGRDPVPGRSDGLKAAVCDVTPQYHPQTGKVIALGHVVFYKGAYCRTTGEECGVEFRKALVPDRLIAVENAVGYLGALLSQYLFDILAGQIRA